MRLALPDLVPLPLRLRRAVLAPLTYSYLHKEIRLVREFDLRMARESHRNLEEVPGWWDDERIVGTPLFARVSDANDPVLGIRPLALPWASRCTTPNQICSALEVLTAIMLRGTRNSSERVAVTTWMARAALSSHCVLAPDGA